MNNISLTSDELVDRLKAMREMEEKSYSYRCYFPDLDDSSIDTRLNVTWREKICQWSYNVVDQ